MRILVTGGAGRLGHVVSRRLVENGHKVRGFDLPHVDWSHVEQLGAEAWTPAGGFKYGEKPRLTIEELSKR